MASEQVCVPFFDQLQQKAFDDPATLSETPPGSPTPSVSSNSSGNSSRGGNSSSAYRCSRVDRGIPVSLLTGSGSSVNRLPVSGSNHTAAEDSSDKSNRSRMLRRFLAALQPMLATGTVNLKEVRRIARQPSPPPSLQAKNEEDVKARITQNSSKRPSSLERDENGKMTSVHRVVSPDIKAQTTAAVPDTTPTGADSVCLDHAASSKTDEVFAAEVASKPRPNYILRRLSIQAEEDEAVKKSRKRRRRSSLERDGNGKIRAVRGVHSRDATAAAEGNLKNEVSTPQKKKKSRSPQQPVLLPRQLRKRTPKQAALHRPNNKKQKKL